MSSSVGTKSPGAVGDQQDARFGTIAGSVSLLGFIAGAISTQRFTIPHAYHYAFLVPFVLYVAYSAASQLPKALGCLLSALATITDNGSEVYAETPAPLRYGVCIAVIVELMRQTRWRVDRQSSVVAAFAAGSLVLGTAASVVNGGAVYDQTTMIHDVEVAALLSLGLFKQNTPGIHLGPIMAVAWGCLAGELLNAQFFHSADSVEYMSYHSMKMFAALPILYEMFKRRRLVTALLLVVPTAKVLALFSSRMLILSVGASIVIGLLIALRRRFLSMVAAILALPIASGTWSETVAFAVPTRVAAWLESFSEVGRSAELDAWDQVRLAEHALFFRRAWIEVFCGSGLGSGIKDTEGLLNFVRYGQYAFSREELQTATFFNFHDYWVDFGLRFGLAFVAFVTYRATFFQFARDRAWAGVVLGLVLLNASFSMGGLLLCLALYRLSGASLDEEHSPRTPRPAMEFAS